MCVYDQNALETAFRGPYKHQKTKDSIWEPYNEPVQMAKVSGELEQLDPSVT